MSRDEGNHVHGREALHLCGMPVLGQKIGEGSFSQVYVGVHRDTRYAIKIIDIGVFFGPGSNPYYR